MPILHQTLLASLVPQHQLASIVVAPHVQLTVSRKDVSAELVAHYPIGIFDVEDRVQPIKRLYLPEGVDPTFLAGHQREILADINSKWQLAVLHHIVHNGPIAHSPLIVVLRHIRYYVQIHDVALVVVTVRLVQADVEC